VFQDTALFPHLNVRRNISFGLDMRKSLTAADISRRVEEAAKMLQVHHLLDRKAHELSGGQGQRVALGRAIVMEPAAFLLDEPLANLDAALRVEMRTEIKLIQRKLDTTMIFVTHDQEEALTLGDKIAVMKDGVVQQLGSPRAIYLQPANLFVGTFIGSPPINTFDCSLQTRPGSDILQMKSSCFELDLPPDIAAVITRQDIDTLTLGIRPEFVTLSGHGEIAGTVKLIELLGSRTLVYIDCGGDEIRLLIQGENTAREGDGVRLSLQLNKAFYFDLNGNNLLLHEN
jgi:multiple sugar transport system ATP-binding protein